MSARSTPRRPVAGARSLGFSIVEVMIALLIISVGLFGIAKMLALAIADTGISKYRSVASIEAASLASSMHVNKAFWNSAAAPASVTVAGSTITDTAAALGTAPTTCTIPSASASGCTPQQMAALDVQTWATNLSVQLPSDTATISCTSPVGVPLTCTITVSWAEKQVNINPASSGGTATPTLTLVVQP